MLILAFILSLELVIAVFFCFDNFQNFLEKSEARSRIRLCQDPQRDSWQRTDTSCVFSKETAAHVKGNLLFPNRDFIYDLWKLNAVIKGD
jgi:hypothetical protein